MRGVEQGIKMFRHLFVEGMRHATPMHTSAKTLQRFVMHSVDEVYLTVDLELWHLYGDHETS
jgi:hypothetical protein